MQINGIKESIRHINSFEKLAVWGLAKDLCGYIYKLKSKFPPEERFGLISQMRGAGISVSSNIAGGSSRESKKEQSYFYTMAFSRTIELLNQLLISQDLVFIDKTELHQSRMKIESLTRGLSGLKRSTKPQTLNPKLF